MIRKIFPLGYLMLLLISIFAFGFFGFASEIYSFDIHLSAGLNIFGYPITIPSGYTSYNLLQDLGTEHEVNIIQGHDPNSQTYETTWYDPNGKPAGCEFTIKSGGGYVVCMKKTKTVTFDELFTNAGISLTKGSNIVSFPSIPPVYTSFDLLRYLGSSEETAGIQRFNTKKGVFETTHSFFGRPTGDKFDVVHGEAYLIHMKAAKNKDQYAYFDLTGWEDRAQIIRRGILQGSELINPPNKCELKPIIHSKRIYENYTVENVAFESLSGFFVTGNLYRPRRDDGPFAAILCPHGHYRTSKGNGRFRADQQIRCAILATMGAVVFSYDMVGWGESTQTSHDHPKALALQLWNSIRVIDFLISISNVDSNRIGVTGASGGATQSILITAVDDRIAVSVPTVMVSANYAGGCNCEIGMPIRNCDNYRTNNVEIAALAAPRPQLIISCGGDWTKNTPQLEYPFIKSIYRFYGAEDLVENLHLADEGHDYGPSKRAGTYMFFAAHLGLSLDTIMATGQSDVIDESSAVIEEKHIMYVFTQDHPRPSYAIIGDTAISTALSGK